MLYMYRNLFQRSTVRYEYSIGADLNSAGNRGRAVRGTYEVRRSERSDGGSGGILPNDSQTAGKPQFRIRENPLTMRVA
jgi:hypothetical protein